MPGNGITRGNFPHKIKKEILAMDSVSTSRGMGTSQGKEMDKANGFKRTEVNNKSNVIYDTTGSNKLG